ncbi:hypothetical protein [Cylindrospermum sp. FACHB-282]|uniref:hypothetical protein n=1 Tax=Cylindrospermum sp. FACHB-282 TaxID=2692794 RepID=UPI00168858DC|nr:hypothetical protein [Cylindrospermum sp. FACHB-282]MBD2387514.1 hypothetical protein [Cylindrospermum sp. FACHB-282]
MKSQLLLTTLFLFSLSNIPTQACSSGNPQSTAYIRRDNNRCEGIQPTEVFRGFRLISFATRGISSYPNLLNLLIPSLGNSTPEVKLQSLDKNYVLDELLLLKNQSRFSFSLKPDILNKAKVAPNTLRALASVNSIYLPVTIGQPSGQYEFVFFTSSRAKFPTFEILRNNKVVYKSPRNNAQSGEVVFTWDGRNAPAGRYEVHYIAEQEQIGGRPEKYDRRFFFEHNPNWLK